MHYAWLKSFLPVEKKTNDTLTAEDQVWVAALAAVIASSPHKIKQRDAKATADIAVELFRERQKEETDSGD